MTTISNHSRRLLTRRRSLQLLAAGGLAALLPNGLWVAGCGGVSSLLSGHLVNLTPTRIAIPVGGYGFIRASTDGTIGSESLFRLGITLPPGVEEVNPLPSTALHLNALNATAAAVPGRYLCGLRVKPRSDVDGTAQDEPFEIIAIPADQSIGLTIGPFGSNGGPASPGGGTQFAVTATATQRLLASEWRVSQAGFTGEVRFRVEGLPTGIQGGFSRPSVTLGEGLNGDRGVEDSTLLTITVDRGIARGTYPFTVLADYGSPVKTATISGELIVGTAPAPTPTPTPRPTPSPTPAPTPTPGPTTTGLVFADILAPVDSRTIEREGTYRLSDEGRTLTAEIFQSDTILRHIDLVIHRTTAIVPGMTVQILNSDSPNRASFEFTQEGGTPYYQRYKAAAFGSLHIEAGPGGKLRIDIDGILHLLSSTTEVSGSFNLRGSMILRQTE